MAPRISVFRLGHLDANRTATVVVLDDTMGLNATFHRYPAGWSLTQDRFNALSPEASDQLNALIRDHPVLGTQGALDFMGVRP